jgi:hypothetical protein
MCYIVGPFTIFSMFLLVFMFLLVLFVQDV